MADRRFILHADGRWFISEMHDAYELLLPRHDGAPAAQHLDRLAVIEGRLEEVTAACRQLLAGQVQGISGFTVAGIEILAAPDRHGADAVMAFTHDGDGYLWVEVGLRGLTPDYTLLRWY